MKIDKSDLRQISYQEYGELLDMLTSQILAYCSKESIAFDLVAPILRSGAFAGMHLASKLGITHVLPVQYKYVYHPEEKIIKLFEFPTLNFSLPQKPKILIVDTNTVYGGIARVAIADIKKDFPQASIYFASVNLDQSVKHLDGVTQTFHARISNNKRELNYEEEYAQGISHELLIYPWESLEEQWQDINGSENT